MLTLFSPFPLLIHVKSKIRLNACIQELNFLRGVAKRRRAEDLFALLFALLAILHLVIEQTIFTNFEIADLFAVDTETKYIGYYQCYGQ